LYIKSFHFSFQIQGVCEGVRGSVWVGVRVSEKKWTKKKEEENPKTYISNNLLKRYI
jgi:hypothetical protein